MNSHGLGKHRLCCHLLFLFSFPTSAVIGFNLLATRTLHQCLPIEKELIWAKHCASAHEKIETNLKNLQLSFDEVAGVISRLEMPLFDSDALQAIVTKAEMDFVQQVRWYLQLLWCSKVLMMVYMYVRCVFSMLRLRVCVRIIALFTMRSQQRIQRS